MFTTDSSTAMLINQPDSLTSSTPVNLVATTTWGGTYYNLGVLSYNQNPVYNANTGDSSALAQCAQDSKSLSLDRFLPLTFVES